MKLNNEESRSIREALSLGWVQYKISGEIGISRNKQDKKGAETLAQADGAVESDAKSATNNLYPKKYRKELDAAKSAYTALMNEFKKRTHADGLYEADKYLSDPLEQKLKPFFDELDKKRQEFITAYPSVLQAIYQDDARGAAFNWGDYPSQTDLAKSFKVTLVGPLRLGPNDPVVCTSEMAAALDAATEQYARQQVVLAQQEAYKKLLDYLKPIVTQLTARAAHDDGSNKQNKAPKVSESLYANIRQALEVARQFAIPGTPGYEPLLTLTKEIEFKLELDIREVEDFKDNPPLARAVAQDAQAILEAMESLPGFE